MSGAEMEEGNIGHRPGIKGGYFPVPPVDSGSDLRSEMVSVIAEMGVTVEKHHHEVAPSQHELGIKFDTLVRAPTTCRSTSTSCTTWPMPGASRLPSCRSRSIGDNGSGMHTHQSIWKDGKPIFAGSGYADLSETALYYIGGIIKHAKAVNAFTNASTNSYKRLIPGFEGPYCSPIQRATGRLLAVSLTQRRQMASVSRSGSRTRRRTRISLLPRC